MEGRWFVSNPPKGKVRLDYVSTARPFPGTKPLSDRRFRQVSRGQPYPMRRFAGLISRCFALVVPVSSPHLTAKLDVFRSLGSTHNPNRFVSGCTPSVKCGI